MGPIEALQLALNKEIEAKGLYDKLSVEHSPIKDLCLFLANEEAKHRQLIEKKIQELTK